MRPSAHSTSTSGSSQYSPREPLRRIVTSMPARLRFRLQLARDASAPSGERAGIARNPDRDAHGIHRGARVDERVEALRRHAPAGLRRRTSPQASRRRARGRYTGSSVSLPVRRRLVEADAEPLLRVALDRAAARRLAGFRVADLQHVPARRPGAEVMIEGDDAVHLGARQVERARDHRHGGRRDAAEVGLHAVQDLDQRADAVAMALDEFEDARFIRRAGNSAALIAAARGARTH